MEHGTTTEQENSTGEKYSPRWPVLELYFLREENLTTESGRTEARDSKAVMQLVSG